MQRQRKADRLIRTEFIQQGSARTTTNASTSPVPSAVAKRQGGLLFVLLAGQAMAALDGSITNVAAPSIRHDLGTSGAVLQLVIFAYILAYAVLLVTGARLGDDFGYRRLFTIGLGVFTLASLACGAAPTAPVLVLARIVQGAGAAMMVPQVLSMIQVHLRGAARAKAVGYYSLILAVGVAIGQLLGGVVLTLDIAGLSWRPAFLINVPIGVAVLVSSRYLLPGGRSANHRPLDIPGVLALSLAMVLVVIPLTFVREVAWAAWIWGLLALGLAGLVVFGLVERFGARNGGSPVLDLEVLSAPGIKAALIVVFGLMGQYGGFLFTVTLYLQSGLGYTPIGSGLTFTAYALGFAFVNLNWTHLPERFQRRTPTAALLVLAMADVMIGLVVRSGWKLWFALPLLVMAGAGHGAGFGPLVNQMVSKIKPRHAPALSGLVSMSTQLGIVVGIAALGSIYLGVAHAGSRSSSGAGLWLVALTISVVALVSVVFSVRLAGSPRPPASSDADRQLASAG